MELTTEHCHSCSWSAVWGYVHAPEFHMLLIGDMFAAFMEMAFSMSIDFAWKQLFKHSPLPSLPLSSVNSVTVMGACLPFLREESQLGFLDLQAMRVISIWE